MPDVPVGDEYGPAVGRFSRGAAWLARRTPGAFIAGWRRASRNGLGDERRPRAGRIDRPAADLSAIVDVLTVDQDAVIPRRQAVEVGHRAVLPQKRAAGERLV